MLDSYRDFDLHLSGHCTAADGTASLLVQVMRSPVGSQLEAECVAVPPTLAQDLAVLASGGLDAHHEALVQVGRQLADLMMPPVALGLFLASYAKLGQREGLRLRLHCTGETLHAYPWEMAHCERGFDHAGASDGSRGFLVLDSKVSMVRAQAGSRLGTAPRHESACRRIVALMSDPPSARPNGRQPLALDRELKNIQDALAGNDGFDPLTHVLPTRQDLQDALLQGAHYFHFAGHGGIHQVAGRRQACLMLQTQDGSADPWPVDALAVQLANRGIELAMLNACYSATRDSPNPWSSIAPSLVRAGIPAVLGMQFDVLDKSAVPFSRMLYLALAKSMPLDEAVTQARLAVYNTPNTGRDFATPVLYVQDSSALPSTEPRVPEPPRRANREVEHVKRQLAELDDSKQLHDTLHSAKVGEVEQMREQCFRPARQRSPSALLSCTNQLSRRLASLQTFLQRGHIGTQRLQDIAVDFEDALGQINAARAQGSMDALVAAVAALGSLLTTQMTSMDTAMSTLSDQLRLDTLTAFLRQLPTASTPSAENRVAELQLVESQLREGARLHQICQNIDNRLTTIWRTERRNRVRELRSHWPRLSNLLTTVESAWAEAGDQILPATAAVQRGLSNNDDASTLVAFEDLRVGFDFGFYFVDANFKSLCEDIQRPTHVVQEVCDLALQG